MVRDLEEQGKGGATETGEGMSFKVQGVFSDISGLREVKYDKSCKRDC